MLPPTPQPVPARSLAAIQESQTQFISVQERSTPTPCGTQVLVKINYTGVCASDLHLARRDLPYLQRTVNIGGHEGAGTIVALGPSVETNTWCIGDRVAVRWLHSICKKCEVCTTGFETICPNRKVSGKDVEGCFAQYALADSTYLARLPDEVEDRDAAPILCAGVTVYKALKLTALRKGSWVAVAGGGGGLGHLAVQYAKAMGLRPLALDSGKRDICMALGAEAYIDFMEENDVVSAVNIATNGGAHGALLCASSGRAYADAVKYLRRAGTMVCIGLPPKPFPIPVIPEDFISRGIKIMGTSTGTVVDTEEALAFVARKEVKPQLLDRSLDDISQVLRDIEDAKVQGRIVIKL